MSRVLTGVVLAALLGAPRGAREDKPKEKPAVPGEKIDAKANRSLTGVIEKVDAKNEKAGTFVLRAGEEKYTFQVDGKTKVLRATGDPLEGGLGSPLLKNAQVRVLFFDKEAKGGPDKA